MLAQPNSDVGHFSVGDPYNGEKPLVVWVYHYIDNVFAPHEFSLAAIMADASMSMTTRPPVVEHGCRPIHSFRWSTNRVSSNTTGEVSEELRDGVSVAVGMRCPGVQYIVFAEVYINTA